MIIDHDTMTEIGPTDETMPLRVITPVEPKVDYPAAERKMQWAGPFPVRRVESMTGRLSIRKPEFPGSPRVEKPAGVVLEKFAREAPIEDVVEAVKILSEPAPLSGEEIAKRSASHVQRLFTEAGWNIAVWYGEHTKEFWVWDEKGLHSFSDLTSMYQGMGWEAL